MNVPNEDVEFKMDNGHNDLGPQRAIKEHILMMLGKLENTK